MPLKYTVIWMTTMSNTVMRARILHRFGTLDESIAGYGIPLHSVKFVFEGWPRGYDESNIDVKESFGG